MTVAPTPEKLLTTAEAAELLNLKPATLVKWRATGAVLPFVRLGAKTIRYRRADVLRVISGDGPQAVKVKQLGV